MLAELYEGRILLDHSYRDIDTIRGLPGASFGSKAKRWSMPLTWGACITLRGAFGERLEVGPRLTEWATVERCAVESAARARERAMDATSGASAQFEEIIEEVERARDSYLSNMPQ